MMIEKLLAALAPAQRQAVEATLEDDDVAGIVVWRTRAGSHVVQAFDASTDTKTDLSAPPERGAVRVGWWAKALPADEIEGRTRKAAAWWAEHPEASGRDAAEKFGVSPSAVYKFAADRASKPICPTCGQVIRKGFGGN